MNIRLPAVAFALAAAATLACAAPARAAAPPPGGVGAEHGGFYFSTDVGPAYGQYRFSGPRDSGEASGGAASVDLRFGYALTRQLVLSGDLTGTASVKNPDTTLDGRTVYARSDFYFGTSAVGVGLTWYFADNLLVGANLGAGKVILHYNNSNLNIDSNTGFSSQLRFGKEWWVGEHWALGVVGGVEYVSASADSNIGWYDARGTLYTAHIDHVDATTYFVAFSATFN